MPLPVPRLNNAGEMGYIVCISHVASVSVFSTRSRKHISILVGMKMDDNGPSVDYRLRSGYDFGAG